MTWQMDGDFLQGRTGEVRHSAQTLEGYSGELQELQDTLGAFTGERWRSPAGAGFLERLQEVLREIAACRDALQSSARARWEVAGTAQCTDLG